MTENLFQIVQPLLEEVYEFVEDKDKMENSHKILDGKELKSFYYVLDLCQSIYESENFFND